MAGVAMDANSAMIMGTSAVSSNTSTESDFRAKEVSSRNDNRYQIASDESVLSGDLRSDDERRCAVS